MKKHMFNFLFLILAMVLICVIAGMHFFPEQTSKFIGFQFYTVLTDSMEPDIPTYSLVLTKQLDEEDEIPLNSIITFQVERGGKQVYITHYYRKFEHLSNQDYFRTQPALEKETFDPYDTTRSDIIGTYIGHIPYVGKFMLFLQSPFGWVLVGEFTIIWLVKTTIKSYWIEKEKQKQSANRCFKRFVFD